MKLKKNCVYNVMVNFLTCLFAPSSLSAAPIISHAGNAPYRVSRTTTFTTASALLILPAKAALGDGRAVSVECSVSVLATVSPLIAIKTIPITPISITVTAVPAGAAPLWRERGGVNGFSNACFDAEFIIQQ